MLKDIYIYTIEGELSGYAHFFFSGLIALIEYDINNYDKKYDYMIKVNIYNFNKILDLIFKNRIKYEKQEKQEKQEKDNLNSSTYLNYDIFLKLGRDNKLLLNRYDFFNDKYFQYSKEYKLFEKDYIKYKTKLDILTIKYYNKQITKNENLERKILFYSNSYFQLIKSRFKICKYIHDRMPIINIKCTPIILINRPKPKYFSSSNLFNTSGQRRFIFNFNKLKNQLKLKYNEKFSVVILEEMNIFEQYYIFNNAKIIIGQHGAGLCNIFFMDQKKDNYLIEIIPEWNNGWFKNLSQLCNINYISIKQKKMTLKQTNNFFKNFNGNIDNNIIKDYFEKKYESKFQDFHEKPEITLIKNSGSINIKKIIKHIDNIIK
jgi:hypothetical protein